MKTITAKYPGTCDLCGQSFPKGEAIAAFTASWHHVACVERELAGLAAEDARQASEQVRWTVERKAGLHADVRMNDREILVFNAWDYSQAKDLAFQLIESATPATGLRYTIRAKRNPRTGKRTVGRELRSGGYNGTMTYHEGWAFEYRAA